MTDSSVVTSDRTPRRCWAAVSENSKPLDGTPPFRVLQWARRERALISFAQNAEDIRLARVFDSVVSGRYVDVGAGDPVEDSVTKLFYDRGWSGINIEPGPVFEKLETERPRDLNLRLAIGSRDESREFWVSPTHPGLSTLYPQRSKESLVSGVRFERHTVACRPLSEVLLEHGVRHHVDFMKIDVEGAEADVIQSIDFQSIRPTVFVIEAIAPLTLELNYDSWEPTLIGAGYVFAAFDGVNRFYVPEERQELVSVLSYPISILDPFVRYRELTPQPTPAGRSRPRRNPLAIRRRR